MGASVGVAYEHVQRGFIHLPLLALAVLFPVLGGFVPDVPRLLFPLMAIPMALLALSFAHLRVRGAGDHLEIRFGPLPLFGKRVAYRDIVSVAADRSRVLDGWGIHWLPVRGWIYNVSGFDCVAITTRRGRLRVGTDDPGGLATFLQRKIADRSAG